MNNLLNRLLWTGFKWTCYSEDTSSDYRSNWLFSYGFYLESLDIVVTTDEYTNRDYVKNTYIIPYEEDIFTSSPTYYAVSDKLNFEIRTANFEIFMALLNSYVTLRTMECFPLVENAPGIVSNYFTLSEVDQDTTCIEAGKYITNTQENLDILVEYCKAKQALERICHHSRY